jgi:hypothetical protein
VGMDVIAVISDTLPLNEAAFAAPRVSWGKLSAGMPPKAIQKLPAPLRQPPTGLDGAAIGCLIPCSESGITSEALLARIQSPRQHRIRGRRSQAVFTSANTGCFQRPLHGSNGGRGGGRGSLATLSTRPRPAGRNTFEREKMAVRLGFEPRQTPPKGVVLPLHYRTGRRKIA